MPFYHYHYQTGAWHVINIMEYIISAAGMAKMAEYIIILIIAAYRRI